MDDKEQLTVVTEQGMFGILGLEDPNERNVEDKKKNDSDDEEK